MATEKGKRSAKRETIELKLREAALAYPEAKEEFPWGERVIKVRGKIFVFLGHDSEDEFHVTAKLPSSGEVALLMPFAKPTGYGLGRAGWVSATFLRGQDVPVEMLLAWIDESYRAVAPVKVVKGLDGGGDAVPPKKAPKKPTKKAPARRSPRR